MNHPNFKTRPDYSQTKKVKLSLVRSQAATALQAGHLNLQTLWWHRTCFIHSRKPKDFLLYLMCRRQLGYPLHGKRLQQARTLLKKSPVRSFFKGLRRHQRNQLSNLINEALEQKSPSGPFANVIAKWQQKQKQWQLDWRARLEQATAVQIVGNSPQIIGTGQAAMIDAADIVIRFNHFQSDHINLEDTGRKLSAWVVAPAYSGPVPDLKTGYAIVAGPAMLYWQQRFQNLLGEHHNTEESVTMLDNLSHPVLQVPLSVWRKQVRRFAAPPSAGALLIEWISSIKNENNLSFTLNLVWFGYDQQADVRYHAAKPMHQPVSRHNWPLEHQWIKSLHHSSCK